MSIVVVGAGIMGLLCARSLARAGHKVVLLEQAEELGRQASWAGGGIALPLYPWRSPEAISLLVKRAYALYPALTQELYKETGIDPEWYTSGILVLESDEYTQAAQWAYDYNFPLQLLLSAEINAQVPELVTQDTAALWLPTVAQFRSSRLIKALAASIKQQSTIQVVTHCEALAFIKQDDRVTAVQTNRGDFVADAVVVTAGAWTANVLAQLQKKIDIFPVRGQMLLWQATQELLSCMILKKGHYIIPRKDGQILVGSSMEQVGFNNCTTKEMYEELFQMAITILPALASYPVVNHWAGLRPGSPKGIPFIGQVPDFANVWINAGHFRNGLTFAPAANELLINLMLEQTTQIPPQYYAQEIVGEVS